MVSLEKKLIERLSAAGILAYLAVSIADGSEATTAALAALVKARTQVMLDGLKELSVEAPERVAKHGKNWQCGIIKAGEGVILQNLDSERYRLFVDDLKKYWDFLNPTLPFEMGGKDGIQIRQFLSSHREWHQADWRIALTNRKISVKRFRHASPSQPLWAWVGRLADYHAGPLDPFNRPAEGGGKVGRAIEVETSNREARAAVLNGSPA